VYLVVEGQKNEAREQFTRCLELARPNAKLSGLRAVAQQQLQRLP
jgi:hypothetical protein